MVKYIIIYDDSNFSHKSISMGTSFAGAKDIKIH